MRTGVSIPPFTDPATLVAMARDAEQAGWDGVFLWDHLVFDPGARLDVHDPWVLLGAMALATERVTLGTLVTPLARRRPQMVARHLLTLDHLSGGRAVLGVGLGEPPDADFAAFGDPADPRERAVLLDEGLAVVDGLLRGPLSYTGTRHRVDADLLPRPVQQPRPPIWVAAIAPHRRPRARALRWDGIVPLGPGALLTPDEVTAYLAGFDRPAGWDVVVNTAPGIPFEDYAAAGATWVVEGAWPVGGWVADLRARIDAGP
ncbi:MAG TPA: LLM class flavin-dependent oxidoreductase [Acidimicrobiales bacterium]|nr:LLM class flavin-dependent oxidoreductase [Acidimicrobiales bacterium]